jgi:hypothetical protein
MIKTNFCNNIFNKRLWAVSAYPDIITIHQPDGTPIESYIKGDEWASWHETLDGWSITKNDVGVWVYAEGISGRFLIPGNSVVGQQNHQVLLINISNPLLKRDWYIIKYQSELCSNRYIKIPVIFFQFPDLMPRIHCLIL